MTSWPDLPSRGDVGYRQQRDTAPLLAATLEYARERDYAGWDYVDGMSSRLLRALPVENKWLNLAVQETTKRAPINLRPLFLVEQRRNFKGTALFAMANGMAARLEREGLLDPSPGVDYEAERRRLLEWLLENRSVGYSGFCGGHKHVIQGLHHQSQPNEPDLVSTSYAVKALLDGADLDPAFAAAARSAAEFTVEDMHYEEVDGGATVRYYPKHPDDSYTLNAGAITARMFVDLFEHFGDEEFLERGRQLLDYVAAAQTPIGGWYYRDPPEASHLSMDNHHNGFIVEALQRYHEVTGTERYRETLDDALSFYGERLFEADGAPNWDEDEAYPRDIHAAAQGILVYTYAGDLDFARRILAWTLENLYAGDGRFYYRVERLYTKRITLMRWCQAWMAYAVGELSLAEAELARGERDGSRAPSRPAERRGSISQHALDR